MFNQIFDAIEEWMRELLTGMISSNLDRMFTDVNQKTSEIAGQVGQTPQGWNGSIFSMIEGLSNSVIMPIAGIIITFVLCYELISMLTERNNMHDGNLKILYRFIIMRCGCFSYNIRSIWKRNTARIPFLICEHFRFTICRWDRIRRG